MAENAGLGVLLGLGARRRSIGPFTIAGTWTCFSAGRGWPWLVSPFLIRLEGPVRATAVSAEFTLDHTPIGYDPRWPLLFIAITVVVGLVASALPAWRAGRIDPVLTIRSVTDGIAELHGIGKGYPNQQVLRDWTCRWPVVRSCPFVEPVAPENRRC